MTAFLRNTLLAAAAVSALTGSALAEQTIPSCAKTSLNDLWSGRCCGAAGASDCLGGGNGGRDHGNHGDHGRGGNGGSTAGKN
ncbi:MULTISPECIES: hypothetical protein [unclassified Mesorhizobium]|uniref:hypothetical protein n=1 Tax=unclassified Mesorhizobium TaxID=325217 RepID=UPI000FCAF4A0|nr:MULTISPECIES: hypothetical protein [unclassified Mesorhizobium]RUW95854.1 hypothetical protein EOA35_29010 [Mesorhizobium sp. M8A.F.Ca.ET.023.01.1.1]RUX08068.1 hypothetical protein EOA30_07500 [Mesorhizobium sp. M8A.F.Ca.ET.059.01.1.1]TGR36734.1 hypothetical protein EN842_53125 [bacterium M00.F.Ca.ET.199.01.1.1]TGU17236.1 hypothetical protein EN799_63640 [bacterium M00.F.Ca.ET.156.01.1.1]TGU87991.1 hypothetical protein EN794_049260 [Mesorhizobium sp. M00.F.Ca.ET.151.01.1.1]TGV08678.1 hypot